MKFGQRLKREWHAAIEAIARSQWNEAGRECRAEDRELEALRAQQAVLREGERDMAKRAQRQASGRVCVVCKYDLGTEGPLPYEADVHPTPHGMAISCSPQCRQKGGYPERKRFAGWSPC